MSFYLNLRSNESDNIYPNNHASDFFIELNDNIHLEGNWEVALADITYCGQLFANLPRKDGLVNLRLSGKQKMGEIVVTHMESDDIYILVYGLAKLELRKIQDYFYLGKIEIRRSHFTWDELKVELVKGTTRFNRQNSNKSEVVTLLFDDKKLTITVKSVNHLSYKFIFSDKLKQKLNINSDPIEIIFKDSDFKIVDIKKPDPFDFCKKDDPLKCSLNKFLLLSRYSVGPHWIRINEEDIYIYIYIASLQFWTWHLFSDYYNKIFKERFPNLKFSLDGNKYCFFINSPAHLQFSKSLQYALSVPASIKVPPTTSPIILNLKLAPEEESASNFIEESDYLPSLLYEDRKILLKDLNSIIKQLFINAKTKRGDNLPEIPDEPFFQIREDHKVEFKITEAEINLSDKLTNMLHLTAEDSWITSQLSSKPLLLGEYTTPYFYLYIDCIELTGANNYLRLINNVAKVGEHVQIAFNNLYYYSVSKEYINNIHITLTDSEGEDLNLLYPINLILHFRKCPSM